MTSDSDRLPGALALAERGFRVFPLRPSDKRPLISGWQNAATTDASRIRQWWEQSPTANIGVATGHRSGAFVLDVDVKSGADGTATLRELEERHGTLPSTLTATTPSGGYHHFFLCDEARDIRNSAGFLPGLDIRGNGGYVVAAPSTLNNGSYAWVDGSREIVHAPSWLIECCSKSSVRTREASQAATLREGAPEGERNIKIFRYASSLRSNGLAQEDAETLVLDRASRCSPPFPEDEALQCLQSAYTRYFPDRALTELGNAERLRDTYGDEIRYLTDSDRWILWNGNHWQTTEFHEIEQRAKAVIRNLEQQARDNDTQERRERVLKHCIRSERAAALANMIRLAANEPGIPISTSMLDTNKLLLGVKNGTINLSTGQYMPPDRGRYISKHCNVDYDAQATCPIWDQFVLQIMDDDPEMRDFLCRCVGYTLIGGNPDQFILFLCGSGANGKSTFLNTIQHLMGSYARSVENSLFMRRRFSSIGGPREDIVRLKSARFILTTEIGEGEVINEEMIKRITGDDTLTARPMYGRSTIEFQPQFTPWMATNHKPIIPGQGYAIWRRIQLIEFNRRFDGKGRDPHIGEKLQAELPGILNWALRGCIDYQNVGLTIPESVQRATAAYKTEMDLLAEWIEECCVLGTEHFATNKDLYGSYWDWSGAIRGIRIMNPRTFGRKLTDKGFECEKRNGQRGHVGIAKKEGQTIRAFF